MTFWSLGCHCASQWNCEIQSSRQFLFWKACLSCGTGSAGVAKRVARLLKQAQAAAAREHAAAEAAAAEAASARRHAHREHKVRVLTPL